MYFDTRWLLGVAQILSAILAMGLLISWYKHRNAGVLLTAAVFAGGAYYSMTYADWWPLIGALGAGALFKKMGFQTGYHS